MAARKSPKRQAWSGLCPAGKHGLDFEGQRCDLCKHAPLVNRAANAPQASGVMRVKVEERPGMPQFGVLVGMLVDEHGDMQAVVRLDHFGLMLKALHPSKVVPVTPEDEEAHKP